MQPQRIVVLGISGAGKTTFARQLAQRTGLPLFFMDEIFWCENWRLASDEEQRAAHAVIIARDRWILEGYAEPDIAERLRRADAIIWLDYLGWLCALRGLRRWWEFRGRHRPELAAGCIERLEWSYIFTMFRREERPSITDAIDVLSEEERTKIIRFTSPRAAATWLASVTSA